MLLAALWDLPGYPAHSGMGFSLEGIIRVVFTKDELGSGLGEGFCPLLLTFGEAERSMDLQVRTPGGAVKDDHQLDFARVLLLEVPFREVDSIGMGQETKSSVRLLWEIEGGLGHQRRDAS